MLFRNPILTKPLAIFTGIIFLNLSFILAEVNALEIEKKNRVLYENLVSLIFQGGFEKEKDTAGESSGEPGNEVSPYLHLDTKFAIAKFLIENFSGSIISSPKWLYNFREVFSPPPEQ